MPLKDCIEKAGKLIPPAQADAMLARAEALKAEGELPDVAEARAVAELQAEVARERSRLEGVVPVSEGGERNAQVQRQGETQVTPRRSLAESRIAAFRQSPPDAGTPYRARAAERIMRVAEVRLRKAKAEENLRELRAKAAELKVKGEAVPDGLSRRIEGLRADVTRLTDEAYGTARELGVMYSIGDVWRDNILDSLTTWQTKGTPDQLRAHLAKTRGAQDEADWIGLDDFLKDKKSVTRAEVEAFVKANQVEVREVVKSDYSYLAETATLVDEGPASTPPGATKFSRYTLPGGQNYRELLLALPANFNAGEGPLGGFKVEPFMSSVGPVFRALGPDHSLLGIGETREEALLNAKAKWEEQDGNKFHSTHFDEPNIVAHIRFNERTDADGKRVLFIEEIQSDWHQKGRKKGYVTPETQKNPYVVTSAGNELARFPSEQKAQDFADEHRTRTGDLNVRVDHEAGADAVPNAPFKTTWPMLAMKRAIRWAAENGFDRVAWATGEQQAERYNKLLRDVTSVGYKQEGSDKWRISVVKRGESFPIHEGVYDQKTLPEIVGKPVAERIVKNESDTIEETPGGVWRVLEYPDGIVIGGEGMKAFYDRMLPSEVNKFVKKWGGRVGQSDVLTETTPTFEVLDSEGVSIAGPFITRSHAESQLEKVGGVKVQQIGKSEKVHSLDITPAMRDAVMQGMPMFSIGDRVTPATVQPILDELRKEYPSAPEFLIGTGLPTEDQQQGAVYRDGKIHVFPAYLGDRRQARSAILRALVESGADIFPLTKWEALWPLARRIAGPATERLATRLRADIKTPEGRRAVLAAYIRESSEERRLTSLPRRMIRILRGSQSRELMRAIDDLARTTLDYYTPQTKAPSREGTFLATKVTKDGDRITDIETETFKTRAEAEAFAGPDGTVNDSTEDQAFADLYRAWYEVGGNELRKLRASAMELGIKAKDDDLWRRLETYLRKVADDAAGRELGASERRVRFNPASTGFLEDIAKTGYEVDDALRDTHRRYRAELSARGLLRLMDQRDELKRVRDNLVAIEPRWTEEELAEDRAKLDAQIDKLDKKIAKRSGVEHTPATDITPAVTMLDRAEEIRGQQASLPDARAAELVLANPFWVEVAEVVDKIEDSGLSPRPLDSLSVDQRRSIAEHSNIFYGQYEAARTQAANDAGTAGPVLERAMTRLMTRLDRMRTEQAESEIAVKEIRDALAGLPGTSGSLGSREAAEAMRSLDTAVIRFAIELAKARPDTPVADLREAIAGLGALSGIDVRTLAATMGLSEDVFARILTLIQNHDGFRNGILAMHDAARREVIEATITTIKRVETLLAEGTEESRRLAHELANGAIARLNQVWTRARGIATTVDKEIEDVLVRQLALDRMQASTTAPIPDSGATREMIYPVRSGHYFAGFVRADGSEQPEMWVNAGEPYGEEEVKRLVEWREAARVAIPAGTNDAETTRGLAVGIDEISKFIDLYATPSLYRKTAAPGRVLLPILSRPPGASLSIQLKSSLPKLVPGIFGNLLSAAEERYNNAAAEVDALLDRHHAQHYALVKRAADSLGLDLSYAQDIQKLHAAYDETANGLRQWGSQIAPGTRLFRSQVRGMEVTAELLTLIRFHRDVFRQAQNFVEGERYGGIRMKKPGRNVIRKAVETGDVGLQRMADANRYEAVASVYTKAQGAKDAAAVIQFWENDPDAILTHIQDSPRTDLGVERDPVLVQAEQALARAMRSGWNPTIPSTIDGWVDLLLPYMPTIADPRAYARNALLEELAGYGRVARARVVDSETRERAKSAGTYIGDVDVSEFNTPASKLMFPSSWYRYGASGGSLRTVLERIADRTQVEYFGALANAAKDLKTKADEIQSGINPHREDVIWHTKGWWNSADPNEIDSDRSNAAARMMMARAAAIRGALAHINASSGGGGILRRMLQTTYTLLLSWVTPMITNIVGGPLASATTLRPLLGTPAATAFALASMVASPTNAVAEMLIGMVPKRIRDKLGNRADMVEWQMSRGLGGSYSKEEMGELEDFSRGMASRQTVPKWAGAKGARRFLWASGRAIPGILREGASKLSHAVGVARGDILFNRYIARFVVPTVIWKLKRISLAWQRRIGGPQNYDPNNPDTLLTREDSPFIERIRENLRGIASPEEVMLRLTGYGGTETNLRLFWRTDEGRRIGYLVLADANVATRTNRPAPSTLLSLLGWASKMVTSLVEEARSTPDDSALRRTSRQVTYVLGMAVAAFMAKALGDYARRGANEAITSLAQQLSDLLGGTDDNEDDAGLLDTIMLALARIAAAFRTHTAPEPGPFERAYWMHLGPDGIPGTDDDQWKEPTELAAKVAEGVAGGVGLDFRNGVRVPAVSLGYQLARGGTQAGRGLVSGADGLLTGNAGKLAASEEDIREGLRQVATSFSIWGRLPYNLAFPEDQQGREAKSVIVKAANELGIPRAVVPPLTSFLTPTPVRRGLQDAGRRMIAGDPTAEADALALTSFIRERAYEKAIRNGDSPEEARKNADAAVKRGLSGLNPYEAALGRTLTAAQYDQLRKIVGENPAILRDEAAAKAVIEAISKTPPEGMRPFAPSRAMLTPIKDEGGIGRISWGSMGGGLRRVSGPRLRAGRLRLPRTRRKVSFARRGRLRKVRWA